MEWMEQAAAEDINISPARVITSRGEAEARVWTPGTLLVLCSAPSVSQSVFIKTISFHKTLSTMLTNPPVPYDFYVGDPISRLLTVGSMPI